MAESEKHNVLVKAIITWIEKNKGDKDNFCILTDSGLSKPGKKPRPINGYYPDLFAENFTGEKWIIVGEAKTAKDLDTKRSEAQIKAFLENCALHSESCFILAVPWDITRYAKSLLNHFKKELNLEDLDTIVINELGF